MARKAGERQEPGHQEVTGPCSPINPAGIGDSNQRRCHTGLRYWPQSRLEVVLVF